MSDFVRFFSPSGNEVWINPARVTHLEPDDDIGNTTLVYFEGDHSQTVKGQPIHTAERLS